MKNLEGVEMIYDRLKNMSDEELLQHCLDRNLYNYFEAENGIKDQAMNLCAYTLMARIRGHETEIKRLEAEVERLRCCGNCKSFHHCQFRLSDADVIVKPPENFDCDKWEVKL